MKKKSTIKDVAQAAGVSVGSVSNAINSWKSVRPSTIAKVKEAMKELDYRPNAVARSMRVRATKMIGFVVNDISTPIYAAIMKEAEHLLNKHGYHMLLVDTDNRPGQELEIFESLDSGRIDALVATVGNERDPEIVRILRNSEVPVVLLDRELEFEVNSVCIDYAGAMEKAVNYLTDLQHQNIVLICGGEFIYPGRECIRGFKLALKKRSIDFKDNMLNSGPLAADFACQRTLELLEGPNRPTALICGGNRIFSGALRAIKMLEVRIPEELSVIACDDGELASLAAPGFTVLLRDTKRIGTAISELVIRALQDDAAGDCSRIMVESELLVRNSCASLSTKVH